MVRLGGLFSFYAEQIVNLLTSVVIIDWSYFKLSLDCLEYVDLSTPKSLQIRVILNNLTKSINNNSPHIQKKSNSKLIQFLSWEIHNWFSNLLKDKLVVLYL